MMYLKIVININYSATVKIGRPMKAKSHVLFKSYQNMVLLQVAEFLEKTQNISQNKT